jgi:ornithine cyclodeaminase/alanine dehydrogenase-like protein (mu-crystallin family)
MSVLYLSESDVIRLADVRLALDAVQEAFERLAAGQADNVPRARARGRGIVLHTMAAVADYLGVVGWKNYTTTRSGAQFLVGVHDQESGRLMALLEADHLGQLRTGATTAVAIQWMADREAREVGLFGAGRQAAAQLRAVVAVRPVRRVFVYSRNEERREEFAESMSQELHVDVEPVDRPQEAAEDLPIVITATTSQEPVFAGEWLAEGALVCAIGSNWLGRAEIDSDVIRRADNIVCDSVEACRREAGDFADAISKGIFDWSRAVDLAAVVSGQASGRNGPLSVVLFKSVGLAIEDLALAAKVVQRARQQGLGRELPL